MSCTRPRNAARAHARAHAWLAHPREPCYGPVICIPSLIIYAYRYDFVHTTCTDIYVCITEYATRAILNSMLDRNLSTSESRKPRPARTARLLAHRASPARTTGDATVHIATTACDVVQHPRTRGPAQANAPHTCVWCGYCDMPRTECAHMRIDVDRTVVHRSVPSYSNQM